MAQSTVLEQPTPASPPPPDPPGLQDAQGPLSISLLPPSSGGTACPLVPPPGPPHAALPQPCPPRPLFPPPPSRPLAAACAPAPPPPNPHRDRHPLDPPSPVHSPPLPPPGPPSCLKKRETPRPSPVYPPPPPRPPVITYRPSDLPNGVVNLDYHHDWDENGLIYWLGSLGRTTSFHNPHKAGLVTASWSSGAWGRPENALSRDCDIPNCTSFEPEFAWWRLDLRRCGISVTPVLYTIKMHHGSGGCLRHWVFEGSVDAEDWVVLSRHDSDTSLTGTSTKSWEIMPDHTKSECGCFAFSLFRIRSTTSPCNSFDTNYLSINGFELYGTLTKTEQP